MEKLEVGRFTATTFKDNKFEFVVYDNNTIECPTVDNNEYYRLVIKPRFVLVGRPRYTYNVLSYAKSSEMDLVATYDIDDELFSYLKEKDMIHYSTDMAYLYGFTDKEGFDNKSVRSPYKRAMKKGPILEKQKKGYYN